MRRFRGVIFKKINEEQVEDCATVLINPMAFPPNKDGWFLQKRKS
jgi:hypothetical protein